MRDDQTGFLVVAEEVLEQNLSTQVEEVCRFVQQQQIRIMQQQCRQFHTSLPSAGEFLHRAVEVVALDFELAGHFAAPPVRLAAVAHQEVERRLTWLKRVVLTQVADPQAGMADHLARFEFLFAQDHSQERTFARSVAAHEPDLHVISDRGIRPIQKHLRAITFVGIANLKQHSHSRNRFRQISKLGISSPPLWERDLSEMSGRECTRPAVWWGGHAILRICRSFQRRSGEIDFTPATSGPRAGHSVF